MQTFAVHRDSNTDGEYEVKRYIDIISSGIILNYTNYQSNKKKLFYNKHLERKIVKIKIRIKKIKLDQNIMKQVFEIKVSLSSVL